MKKAFEGFDNLTVTSVSPWLMERAKQSPMLADKKHVVVLNGTDTNVFKTYDAEELRKRHNLGDEKVVFHATPYFTDNPNHLKGGRYVLQLAEKLQGQNVKIFVAGDYDSSLKTPSNVVLLGRVADQTLLARYYSMADVTLLTSKRETFSMVCAESLCCGTPVVGFKAGGPEQISISEYSRFVEYGDVDALYKELTEVLQRGLGFYGTEISRKAVEKYAKPIMTDGYIVLYE